MALQATAVQLHDILMASTQDVNIGALRCTQSAITGGSGAGPARRSGGNRKQRRGGTEVTKGVLNMMARGGAVVLMGAVLIGGVVAYDYLKPTAAPSAPIAA